MKNNIIDIKIGLEETHNPKRKKKFVLKLANGTIKTYHNINALSTAYTKHTKKGIKCEMIWK